MPYKRNKRSKGIKSLIKREIQRNEDRKVEKKRFLGILGESFDGGGKIWSLFGSSTGVAGGDDTTDQFYITLFQGPSATGTNQNESDPSLGHAAIRNFPSNYNISMIGDEIYLENLFMRYRVYKTGAATENTNLTVRVMCVETYDKLAQDASFEISDILEYQHSNYTDGGAQWSGTVLSSINRQIVKRVYHDRTHIVNDSGQMGGVKFDTIKLRLNKKLIAVQKGQTPASGLAMVSVEDPSGVISTPNPNAYVQNNQKILLTPHIYLLVFSDQPDDSGDEKTAVQACWTLRYTDM